MDNSRTLKLQLTIQFIHYVNEPSCSKTDCTSLKNKTLKVVFSDLKLVRYEYASISAQPNQIVTFY